MGILSGAQIRSMVDMGELLLSPFDPELVQPASYDLRLGSKILASPLSEEILGATIELNDKTQIYNVQPGQMVAVISEERLKVPLSICGKIGIRSEFARKGVNAFGGLQIDPGYRGKLRLSLLNVGPEPIKLTLGDPFFTVEFQTLDEPASVGYEGSSQDLDDFPEDQYEFILSARTTSLAEIPTLRQEVRRLSILIEELDEKLPDPDEHLELRPEIEQRLREALDAPADSLLSVHDIRRNRSV